MAAVGVYNQAIGVFQSHSRVNDFNHQQKFNNFVRLVTKDFISSNCLSRRDCSVIRSSASQTSVVDTVSSPSRSKTSDKDTHKKSNEASLILIRHGESLWNEKNLFTGCVDVPLSKKGIDEAIEAGKRISSIPVDLIFTSALIRAQMTAMLAMTQHRRRKIEPQLLSGKNIMIAAHGNSLRSIIMYLDKLTSQEVISLELSTGIPMLYIFKEGRFIRRGSPIGPTEAGVYAYTRVCIHIPFYISFHFDKMLILLAL
uniref:phosphoglycerate mutase (2,3-diphosphoglycerate-dependent) n=1 Tax=Cajanus cajan TaxID=3821 RepID=A0A151TZR2_CAJCA|nr:2,3-bisphosphoglycerate-dependent phosphoglycerate mutase [Cajanus cajan]